MELTDVDGSSLWKSDAGDVLIKNGSSVRRKNNTNDFKEHGTISMQEDIGSDPGDRKLTSESQVELVSSTQSFEERLRSISVRRRVPSRAQGLTGSCKDGQMKKYLSFSSSLGVSEGDVVQGHKVASVPDNGIGSHDDIDPNSPETFKGAPSLTNQRNECSTETTSSIGGDGSIQQGQPTYANSTFTNNHKEGTNEPIQANVPRENLAFKHQISLAGASESTFMRHLVARNQYLESKVKEQNNMLTLLNKQYTSQSMELQRVLAASVQRHSSAVSSLHSHISEQTKNVVKARQLCSDLFQQTIQLRDQSVQIATLVANWERHTFNCLDTEATLHAVAQQHASFIQRMDETLPNGLHSMNEIQHSQLGKLTAQLQDAANAKSHAQVEMEDNCRTATEKAREVMNWSIDIEKKGSDILTLLDRSADDSDDEKEEDSRDSDGKHNCLCGDEYGDELSNDECIDEPNGSFIEEQPQCTNNTKHENSIDYQI
eukprot:gene7281-9712_t